MLPPRTKSLTNSKWSANRTFNLPPTQEAPTLWTLFTLLLVLSWQVPLVHTKDLIQQQQQHQPIRREQRQTAYQHLQNQQRMPHDLLQQYDASRSTMLNNATQRYHQYYEDFETSVVSWTGAKLSNSPSAAAPSPSATKLQHQQTLQYLRQPDGRPHHQLHFGNKRRKTKSGLLIESNIELDYTELTPTTSSVSSGSSEYDTEAELLKATTVPSFLSPHVNFAPVGNNNQKSERKRNRQHQQFQRKRNNRNGNNGGGGGGAATSAGGGAGLGGGQRQKLQRNGKFPF